MKGDFPYLDYVSGDKISCKKIEHRLGMSFVDFLSQRPLESEYIFFETHPSYMNDEIKRFSETSENLNKSGINSAILKPVEISGKIYDEIEDQLICDYISRMQFLLLAYKYLFEYMIFRINRFETLREAYSSISMWYLYKWYKPTFGTKSFSTYLNLPHVKYLRKRKEHNDYDHPFWASMTNVHRFLLETINGERFQNTRRKYSVFVNEMQDIVIPFDPEQKEEYKVR